MMSGPGPHELETPVSLFSGVVVSGDGRGRDLGFPTANIAVDTGCSVPHDGVYACVISFPPTAREYGATMSIGDNPTFADVVNRRIEAYVHDFDGTLYGSAVLVRVVVRLREMERCASVRELIDRTARDVEASRQALAAFRRQHKET